MYLKKKKPHSHMQVKGHTHTWISEKKGKHTLIMHTFFFTAIQSEEQYAHSFFYSTVYLQCFF